MALPSLFKSNKHQRYDYKPRFWNPRKEALEKRLEENKKMQEDGAEASKARIARGLRSGYKGDENYRKQQVFRSNMILLALIAGLVLVSYLFLTLYLPKILESL